MYIDKNFDYIYNYIKYYYSSVQEFKNEKYLIDISKEIKNTMMTSNFTDGKLNFYINNFVGQKLRSINSESFKSYETIKNYIYLLMNYYKIYHGVNIENYSVLLYEISRLISSRYSCDDIVSGNYDSLIEDMVNSGVESKFDYSSRVTIPLDISYLSSDNA